jgi:hypothetical protein
LLGDGFGWWDKSLNSGRKNFETHCLLLGRSEIILSKDDEVFFIS